MRKSKILIAVLLATIGIVVFAAVGMLSSPQQAEASNKVVVKITGDVIGIGPVVGGLVLHVGAQARGPADSLSGQGFDIPIGGGSTGAPGYCLIPLTGTLSGSTVFLSGNVKFAQNPVFDNAPVTFTADVGTGDIEFVILGFVFQGTGKVSVAGH